MTKICNNFICTMPAENNIFGFCQEHYKQLVNQRSGKTPDQKKKIEKRTEARQEYWEHSCHGGHIPPEEMERRIRITKRIDKALSEGRAKGLSKTDVAEAVGLPSREGLYKKTAKGYCGYTLRALACVSDIEYVVRHYKTPPGREQLRPFRDNRWEIRDQQTKTIEKALVIAAEKRIQKKDILVACVGAKPGNHLHFGKSKGMYSKQICDHAADIMAYVTNK